MSLRGGRRGWRRAQAGGRAATRDCRTAVCRAPSRAVRGATVHSPALCFSVCLLPSWDDHPAAAAAAAAAAATCRSRRASPPRSSSSRSRQSWGAAGSGSAGAQGSRQLGHGTACKAGSCKGEALLFRGSGAWIRRGRTSHEHERSLPPRPSGTALRRAPRPAQPPTRADAPRAPACAHAATLQHRHRRCLPGTFGGPPPPACPPRCPSAQPAREARGASRCEGREVRGAPLRAAAARRRGPAGAPPPHTCSGVNAGQGNARPARHSAPHPESRSPPLPPLLVCGAPRIATGASSAHLLSQPNHKLGNLLDVDHVLCLVCSGGVRQRAAAVDQQPGSGSSSTALVGAGGPWAPAASWCIASACLRPRAGIPPWSPVLGLMILVQRATWRGREGREAGAA